VRGRAVCFALALLAAGPAAADEAYITSQNGDDLGILDLTSRMVVAHIKIEGKPAGIAMARDGARAYVTSTNGKRITAVDCLARKAAGSLALPDEPMGIAVSADGRFVYAAGFFQGHLYKIDAQTLKILADVVIGGTPSGLAMTPDGSTLLVTKRDAGELALIDPATLGTLALIPVGNRPYGVIADEHGRAYTANVYGDDVSVVDLAARKVAGTVPVGKRPYVIALADGKGFVSDQYEGKVAVFDLKTLQPITHIAVGDYPDGIQASFDGKSVYAVNWESNDVSVIDTASLKVVATIPVGESPRSFGTFLRKTP
jgi:YVTN family beta-propeller protein